MTTQSNAQVEEEAARRQAELVCALDKLSDDSNTVLAESKKWVPVFSTNYEDNLRYPGLFPGYHTPITLLCALTTHGAAAKNILVFFDKMTPGDIYKSSFWVGNYTWDVHAKQRYGKLEAAFLGDSATEVLISALREAEKTNSPLIEPHHLLLAIAASSSNSDKRGYWYLQSHGLTYELLKQVLDAAGQISRDDLLKYCEYANKVIETLREEEKELLSQIAHFTSLIKSAQSEIGKRQEQMRDIAEHIQTKTNEIVALKTIESP